MESVWREESPDQVQEETPAKKSGKTLPQRWVQEQDHVADQRKGAFQER